MASIKFSAFTNEAVDAATTQLVGYKVGDTSANYRYSIAQLTTAISSSIPTIYSADGTLAGARTITMDGNRLNLNQSTTGDYIKMDAPNANASPTFIDGRRNGATRAKLSLNSGSGRLELFHFGSTKYVDLNPGGVINYFLTDTAIGNTTASAKLHVKGASGADSLLVENNAGTDILTITDAGGVKITGQGYTEQHDQTDLAISWNNSNVVYATLTTGTIIFNPTDAKSGATYILYLRQPASGGPTLINWNNLVLWPGGTPPTLSTAAGATDVITLIYNGTNAKYFGTSVLNFS